MKQTLITDIDFRLYTEISNQSPLRYLKEYSSEVYIDTIISVLYLYTRPKKKRGANSIYLTEVIATLGHAIRDTLKLRKDSSLAAKTGAFILFSFEENAILEVVMGKGKNGHHTYIIQVVQDEVIVKLWEGLPTRSIDKLPSLEPYEPWTNYRHPTGSTIVKTNNKEVLKSLTPETHPIIYECLNKAQTVGWKINEFIYDLHLWALRNHTDAFSDIWEQQNPEAKQTKLREAKAIGSIADRFRGEIFYHIYSYDFRGRRYPASTYLHEQGSDLAKGLLLRDDKKAIGKDGFFWLLVSIATYWAGETGREDNIKTDKLPLQSRFEWALDNEEILISYVENPKVNQGWMKADKPWQFLASCNELWCFRQWQSYWSSMGEYEEYGYESHMQAFLDGTNNGSQHLSALTHDEITAPHVNLVPLELPGDLYKYVADHVWKRLEKIVATYSKEEIKACDKLIDNLIEIKKQINMAEPKSDHRKALIEEIKKVKRENEAYLGMSSPVFWLRIKDDKEKRKIVKRNTMTIPYGGTAFGLGEQQISDANKHGIEQLLFMEHRWAAFMGREVFNACKISLKRPSQLLSIFENAGQAAEDRGEFLRWTVPVTNFPVVQHYTEGKVKKIWCQYGPPMGSRRSTGYFENTLQLAIAFIEDTVPSKHKQAQGAAPNIIHSLDAAHLALTVYKADFSLATVHDSFGCLLGDMPKLYKLVRETFVELYMEDPLMTIMKDIGGDIDEVAMGTLDVELILDSEYAFS